MELHSLPYDSGRRVHALAAAAFSLALAATAGAQAPPATIDACFVPASGTLYRIDTQTSPAPGAPKTCLSPLHTKLTWNQQGPAGPAGPTGLQGAVGSSGAPGPVGAAGADGSSGPPGASGPIGPQGPNGKAGPPGPTGATGAQGPQGPQGQQGQQGQQGAQGLSGTSNAKLYVAGQSGNAFQGLVVNPVVNCPSGQFALGGGVAVISFTGAPPALLQSRPELTNGRPTGWRIFMSVSAGPYNIQSQVICAP